jgi:hypothetical protein
MNGWFPSQAWERDWTFYDFINIGMRRNNLASMRFLQGALILIKGGGKGISSSPEPSKLRDELIRGQEIKCKVDMAKTVSGHMVNSG